MTKSLKLKASQAIQYESITTTIKQRLLIDCDDVDIVYYGGAKGGGKSFAVVLKFIWKLFQERIHEYYDDSNPSLYRICKGIKQTTHRKFYGIIIRKNNYELDELKKICREILPRFGGKLKTQTPYVWVFPSISNEITLTLVQVEKDLSKVQGQQYDFVAVDEICNYKAPYDFISTLKSCMRGAHKVGGRSRDNVRQLVITGNPTGEGAREINKIFVEPHALGGRKFNLITPFGTQTKMSFCFIKALLTDNNYLLQNDPTYIRNIFALRKDIVNAYAFGDLDDSANVFFDSFQYKHILKRDLDNTVALMDFIDNHPYTEDWVRVAGMDWGSTNPYCILFAVRVMKPFQRFKKDDVIIYKEVYGRDPSKKTGGTGESIGQVVSKLKGVNGEEGIMTERERYINIYIDTQMWNKSGFGGDESVTFQMQRQMYDPLSKEERAFYDDEAKRNSNIFESVGNAFEAGMSTGGFYNTIKASNKAIIPSCQYIYGLLREDKIWVMDNCVNLISQLQSIKVDEANHLKPENKPNTEDHAIDTMRYLMMSSEMANLRDSDIYNFTAGASLMSQQCKY
jgi:hypothetical protein